MQPLAEQTARSDSVGPIDVAVVLFEYEVKTIPRNSTIEIVPAVASLPI
jgi:hypothetical protein